MMRTFYEFFAGGGMVREALGPSWHCTFANDIDEAKAATYRQNFGAGKELHVKDIEEVKASDLPGCADLAWASFPCQDLSLAGSGAGLAGQRSGTFWPFWNLVCELRDDGRAPALIVLENVVGALTSHGGKDFCDIGKALQRGGYRFGAMVIDAVHFVPQSRPRLFIVGVRSDLDVPERLKGSASPEWHTHQIWAAFERLPAWAAARWIWWHLPTPSKRNATLADLIEDDPIGVSWHSPEDTKHLLGLMSRFNLAKIIQMRKSGQKAVGGVYRRTRPNKDGKKQQRAEVRFDEISGCLRTPVGGSSRQTLLFVQGRSVRSRLLSAREGARLMGLPETYHLPARYNDAYHLVGDGVVVPVVKHLAENLIEPLLSSNSAGDVRLNAQGAVLVGKEPCEAEQVAQQQAA
jgi:DNA (cytosine-5)-methyltransferase 1